MTSLDELDQLLRDRFDLSRENLISGLRALHSQRPGSARMTADEARLLDAAGFTEDPDSYIENAADVAALMGRLYNTAYTPSELAEGMNVKDSRLRQRRLQHTLWAIDDAGTWVYPSMQFERVEKSGTPDEFHLKHVRGLDKVLPNLLRHDLHPAAVAGLLAVPQEELTIDGRPRSVREWLLCGEPVEPVLQLVVTGDWVGS